MKKLAIILITIILSSCASVKVTAKQCIALNVCTEISYWSKKDHADGVTVKYKDLEFSSNSSVSKDSIIETTVAGGLSDIFKQIKIK